MPHSSCRTRYTVSTLYHSETEKGQVVIVRGGRARKHMEHKGTFFLPNLLSVIADIIRPF
jgi:hypothetical protein